MEIQIHYITDEETNRQVEEEYKRSVDQITKNIKKMNLSEENENKLLRLTDYIFHIHEKYSYVDETYYPKDNTAVSPIDLTVYPDLLHDMIQITGFKEESMSFYDSTRIYDTFLEAVSTVLIRSAVHKESGTDSFSYQIDTYYTIWDKQNRSVHYTLPAITFIYSILATIALQKKEYQKVLTKKKFGVTYKSLTEEYLSDSERAIAIYKALREYEKSHPKTQTIHGIIRKKPSEEVTSDNPTEILYENYSFISPVNAVFDNTKVGRMIFTKEIQDALRTEKFKDGIPVPVSPKNAKRESDVTLAIDFSNFKTSKYLTGDHKDVLNAVNSIIEAGNDKFTLSSLYEQVYQKTPKRSYQLEELKKTVDDLRGILITIDYTQHMEMNGVSSDGKDFMIRRQNALSLDEVTVSINGMKTTVYKLLQEPPTYTYPKACKQIVTIPKKYLETKSVSNTEQARKIKRYVVERINAYNGGKISSTIKYDEIYSLYSEASGIDISEMTKEKKKNARDITKKILNDFKNNEFITGFKENATTVNGKNTFTSVTFTCKKL